MLMCNVEENSCQSISQKKRQKERTKSQGGRRIVKCYLLSTTDVAMTSHEADYRGSTKDSAYPQSFMHQQGPD